MNAQEFSEEIIRKNLEIEVYIKRGLSRKEYIQCCKIVWDHTPCDFQTEKKILLDFLIPDQLLTYIGNEDTANRKELEKYLSSSLTGNMGIICYTIKRIPAETQSIRHIITASPEVKYDLIPDFKDTTNPDMYFVGMFEVVGFSDLVARRGIHQLIEAYHEIIKKLFIDVSTDLAADFETKSAKTFSEISTAPFQYVYFGDTLMLYLKIPSFNFYMIQSFVSKCTDLVCEALFMGIPVQGGIHFGTAVMHKPTMTFSGSAITGITQFQNKQKWIGAFLSNSFLIKEVRQLLEENMIVPGYYKQYEKDTHVKYSQLTLDWISRWKSKGYPDIKETLERMMNSVEESYKPYYQNTIDFISFSECQSDQVRRLFIHGDSYLINLHDFNAKEFDHEYVIIKKNNGEYIYGRIMIFDNSMIAGYEDLLGYFDNYLFIVKGDRIQDIDHFLRENKNTGIELNELMSFIEVVNKYDIMKINCILYDFSTIPLNLVINKK